MAGRGILFLTGRDDMRDWPVLSFIPAATSFQSCTFNSFPSHETALGEADTPESVDRSPEGINPSAVGTSRNRLKIKGSTQHVS